MDPKTSHFFDLVLWWVVRLLYLSALTSLIPFVALFLTGDFGDLPAQFQYGPLASLGLLFVSIIVLFAHYHEVPHTLSALGWMTLLPGVIAIGFQIVSPDAFIAFLEKAVIGFGYIEPEVYSYLKTIVPNFWIAIAAYVVLGVLLLFFAGKLDREHTLREQFRKVFGPRVQIFRQR